MRDGHSPNKIETPSFIHSVTTENFPHDLILFCQKIDAVASSTTSDCKPSGEYRLNNKFRYLTCGNRQLSRRSDRLYSEAALDFCARLWTAKHDLPRELPLNSPSKYAQDRGRFR